MDSRWPGNHSERNAVLKGTQRLERAPDWRSEDLVLAHSVTGLGDSHFTFDAMTSAAVPFEDFCRGHISEIPLISSHFFFW